MKKIKLMSLVAVSTMGLVLVGCSHKPSGGPDSSYQSAQSDESSIAGGAQTFGINGSDGYQEQAQAQAARANNLAASSDMAANKTIYFSFDSNQLRQRDKQALTAQANYLSAHPRAKIRLEGNTDDRGSREYNVGLGLRRDQSVAHYLEQRGVAPKQIQMVSYGKEHPAAFGENEKAWRLNRRVNMIYKNKS